MKSKQSKIKAESTAPVTGFEIWAEQADHLYKLADLLPGAAVAVGPPEQAAASWPASQRVYVQTATAPATKALEHIFRPLFGAQWKAAALFEIKAELKMMTEAEQKALFLVGDTFQVCPYVRFDGYHQRLREAAQEFTRRAQVSGPVNIRFFSLAKGEYARCGIAFVGLRDESGLRVPGVYFRGSQYWRGTVEIFRLYQEYPQLTKGQFRALRNRSGSRSVAVAS